jgi:hypothetical protein
MTDLRKFTTTAILEMARSISRELDDSTASLDQLVSSLEVFKFRDPSASYWTIGPRSLQWYRYVQEQWRPAGQPSGTLEGPEILNGWIVASRRREPPAQRSRPEPQVSNAPEFLQAMVQETRLAYEQGEISSDTAEASLAGFYLLDCNGIFWTPGFRTQNWYSFASRSWSRALEAPAPETLLDLRQAASQSCANCGNSLGEGDKFCRNCGSPAPTGEDKLPRKVVLGVVEFLSAGLETLPEPVTDPWAPPQGFPEMIRQCRVCATADVGNHSHCRVCRSPLTLHPSSSPTLIAVDPPPAQQNTFRPALVSPLTSSGDPQALSAPGASTAAPAGSAPERPTARRPRSSRWLWILAGGCILVFLCSACALLILWSAYSQGYLGV